MLDNCGIMQSELIRRWSVLPTLTNGTLLEAMHAMAIPNTITRVFEYKIRPNKSFVLACENVLTQCQRLYNACLEQRISYYQYQGKTINWIYQARELTELREVEPSQRLIPRDIQTEVLKRLDKAYQAFFRRVRTGEKAGFPRFRSRDRYNSFEYAINQRHSCALIGNKLRVAGIGTTRLTITRPIQGQIKVIRIIKRANGWFAQLVCAVPKSEALPKAGESIGLDMGLEKFATLSNGEQIENPRFGKKAQETIANSQRILARKRKGSNSRNKAKRVVAKAHAKIVSQRKDFAFKEVNKLVKRFDVIAIEKLNVKGLAQSNLAKSINDAAWSTFINILRFKAEWAGREVVEVPAQYTSQDCSSCGHRQKLELKDRVYSCPKCGLVLNRDHNAAINILGRGASLLAEKLTRRAISGVRGEAQDVPSLRLSLA